MNRYILGMDPSGNFKEGKGITGLCYFDAVNGKIMWNEQIRATAYSSQEEYWQAHLTRIDEMYQEANADFILAVEDYRLYASKAGSQVNSSMETIQLLGIIKMHCANNGIHIKLRMAALVKTRWKDSILEHRGHLVKEGNKWYNSVGQITNDHKRDAIRHAVHCAEFENRPRREDI